jgi:hypothetical protein
MKTLKTLLSIFAIVAVFSAGAYAQSSDDITATADVVSALTVVGVENLEFGTVTRGTTETIAPDATDAGKFVVTEAGADFDIDFTLPGSIEDGANSMTLAHSATSALWSNADDASGATGFDPNSTENVAAAAGDVYIWLGGELTVAANQPAGNYSGTITLAITNN